MSEAIALTDLLDERSSRFDSASLALAEAILGESPQNLTGLLHDITPMLGLQHIACLRFETNRSDDLALLAALVTFSKVWQLRYFTRRYHQIDPVAIVGLKATSPFDWRPYRDWSRQVAAFFADALEHGVGPNGVTVPVRGRPGGFALVSFSSNLPDAEWEAFKTRHLAKLKVMACLVDVAASINAKLASKHVELSKREHEALMWAARGKTSAETADIMNISYASVRTYIETARRKLSCENVTHAVASALAIGLIPAQALKGTDPIGYSGKDETGESAA
ncbi:LuxR family transcriptional regulator [Roseiarcus sp.]|uniref:LuxR family transcriptional regulator n=1 Tax=Roseiarcus sp. TaxID=1969460 RepID=UPI003F9DE1B6